MLKDNHLANVEDPFSGFDLSSVVDEYYKLDSQKKEVEKKLKELKQKIIEAAGDRNKFLAGEYVVSIIRPDKSHLDEEKTIDFLKQKGLLEKATKQVLDEEKLYTLIEDGEIDLEELKAVAWVEEQGSPRLSVKEVKK